MRVFLLKICPFIEEGCLTTTLGQKFKFIASLIKVNEPLINACDAMMVAAVAIITAGMRNQCGIISKKGFSPCKVGEPWCISQADCPK